MIASRIAVDLIQRREGYSASAYQDAAGVWTIGFGTTGGVKSGDKINIHRALKLLFDRIADAEASVINAVSVSLEQHQFDALVSFVYNVGAGAFVKSTLRRKLNVGDVEGAAGELGRWIYAGGKKLAGLMDRRAEEESLFRGEVE